jgi:uroporphyrinogen-III synthase
MRIVVTRPREDAKRTASALRSRGHDVLIAPLMRIEPITVDLSGGWSAVVITSAHALNAISDMARMELLQLPLYAVGDRSAKTAKEAGFSQIHSADGDVDDLVRLVAKQYACAKTPVLYLAGDHRASDLITELEARDVKAQMRTVYRAIALPFPPEFMNALKKGQVDAVLHFSKRSAEIYLANATVIGMKTQALAARHLCLSEQVAEPLKAADATQIAVSSRPNEMALIELLSTLSD